MLKINKMVIEIAKKRCADPNKIEEFLFPEKMKFIDPFELQGVREAFEKIKNAIHNNQKILIYGDYDADGITSTALLYKVLSKIHDQIFYYIPQREGEGYGLNRQALTSIFKDDINLIITVDCGIKSYELINEFTNKGIDFIITDHHIPDEIVPQGIIVNPKLSGEEAFSDLAGVGVAYIIALAFINEYEEIKKIDSDLLQLAALGTVADLVNLNMKNRKIVRKGLRELNRNPLMGIKSLVDKNEILEINSKTIAFFLAPIINSSGRMETPEIALKLLISEDRAETNALAEELIELNNRRKILVEKIYKEAQKLILENHYFSDPLIIIENEGWAQGVLGIVASKILNEYNRPVILLSKSEMGLYKGSGRSIDGYNIFNALKKFESIIEQFGGHAQAAGLSITKENISLLRENLNSDIFKELEHEDFYNEYQIDGYLNGIKGITDDLYKDLALLEPFGTGNPEPLFTFEDPVDLNARKIGKLKDHLKMDISQNNKKIGGIYFNYKELPNENNNNLIFSVGINEWKNKVSFQLEVKKIIAGEKIESQKMEQKIYSDLLFSKAKESKNFTIGERIKYNELWDILKDSKGIFYSKDRGNFLNEKEALSKLDLFIYDNERNFPENFKDIKRFLTVENEAVLLSDSLMLKKEILLNTKNYIFSDEEPYEHVLSFLKKVNPDINIFIMENSLKKQDVSREKLSQLYLIIKKIFAFPCSFNLSEIKNIIEKNETVKMTAEDIVTGVMIFEELDFLEYSLGNGILEVKLKDNPNKTSLDCSNLYTMLNYR